MTNPPFDANLQLRIIEDWLNQSKASVTAAGPTEEDIISRSVVNRAFNAMYLCIATILDVNACVLPYAYNIYYRYFYCVQQNLLQYRGVYIFGRLDKFFDERKKADYDLVKNHFTYVRAQAAIRDAREIIREFETACRNKLSNEGHLC